MLTINMATSRYIVILLISYKDLELVSSTQNLAKNMLAMIVIHHTSVHHTIVIKFHFDNT